MATTFDLDHLKRQLLRKYPAFGTTIANVQYQVVGADHPVQTAGTDGNTIYVNGAWLATLTPEQQLFALAHEVCHLGLQHLTRGQGKVAPVWNIATDAIINQHLQQDGLPIIDGGVNLPDALQYDAETLYARLLKDPANLPQSGHDNHQIWQDATQQKPSQSPASQQPNQGQPPEQPQPTAANGQDPAPAAQPATPTISERQVFAENAAQKVKRATTVLRGLKGLRQGYDRHGGDPDHAVSFPDLGDAAKPVANWRKLLRQELTQEDEAWGHRFSDRHNHYATRLEDVEYDDQAVAEIILDVSGSVSEDLLRNFLRQIKTLLKTTTLQVGTFANHFYGFQTVKTAAELERLTFKIGGGTNFNAASCAFTKRRDVNKICFTDGCDDGDAGIEQPRRDIIWVSYDNPHFCPDHGKVIYVPPEQLALLRPAPDRERER